MKIIQQWKQSDSEFIKKKVIEHNMEQIPDELKTSNENVSFILKDEGKKLLVELQELCFGIIYI
ncbi:hypothetical protein SAMN02982927_01445 [Sporolactobacillus nakayamae]|uniref:Uncharacterized protein n=1 Tax=Sporolactobacillus nakayamae TaxID=269670 RepID=A0A1I2R0F4_9BACL|nr:hypothetical protein SAMN02982927_01445 [Sporolactobacillus nakayamae]